MTLNEKQIRLGKLYFAFAMKLVSPEEAAQLVTAMANPASEDGIQLVKALLE